MVSRTPPSKTLSRARVVKRRTVAVPAVLHVVYPPKVVQTIPVPPAGLTLGRGADDGVSVPHPTVSRRHLAITWHEAAQQHVVRDLGSRNGSAVDGVRCGTEGAALDRGAVLRLGDVVAVFELEGGQDGPVVARDAVPGESAGARAVRFELARAARDRAAVLVVGETGTGKEMVAQELHRLSGRRGPLVAVNCAALSPSLVESELFGHVKGAFTGADAAQAGRFRAADGGTLFLDEVGELSLEMQPKLLRALQEGEIQPVGAARSLRVDVRVVAATHRELASRAESGEFRRDLYARLSLWEIHVPPLRARRADILSWVQRLQERWADERDVRSTPLHFTADAVEALLLAPWPTNLRGLDRLVHALPESATIDRDDLPAWVTAPPGGSGPAAVPPEPGLRLPTPSREELASVLAELGSVRAAARHYGRDRRQIYRWMEAYGLREKP